MKGIWMLLFIGFSIQAFTQTGSNGIRHITKFSGYEFGLAYPYVTKGYKYDLANSHMNYGITGHVSLGRVYESGISISGEPGLFFSSVGETSFDYELYKPGDEVLSYRSEITEEHQILFLQLPAIFEVKIGSKVRIGGGPVLTMPIVGSGYYKNYKKRLHHTFPFYITDEFEYAYKSEFDVSIGFTARILFSLHKSETAERYIGLSYFHGLDPRYPAGVNDKAFSLSFVVKNIVVKEVRQKWDRYLMRH